MRLGLRWKILLITVIAPLSLGLAAFVTVHRNVRSHVNSSSIHENLEHSVRVLESLLAVRGKALAGGAEVIARDPRFFSLLTLEAGQRDSRFAATVRGMARDFNGISRTELFEVFHSRGRRLASPGSVHSTPESRGAIVRQALRGTAAEGVLVQGDAEYQVSATPVRADFRVVGVLLVGSEIGLKLARLIRAQMRCEVTFLSDGRITSTTLADPGDRAALLARLAELPATPGTRFAREDLRDVKGAGLTYVTVVRPIPRSGGRQFYALQRARDPETEFLQQMQRDLGVLAVVGVIAALLTGLALSGSILRPVQQLVRGAQEMQRGNYAFPLDVRRSDEIGYLAQRFTEMRQREQLYVSSLEEAARSKTEFITIASHELRTPISIIQSYRDLFDSGALGPVPPAQRQGLDAIRGCLDDLTRIAEQATRVAELQGERLELKLQPQSVAPLVQRAVADARAMSATRAVRIELQASGAPESWVVDGDLFIQAVTNLVTNGIRFTRDGGKVEVALLEHDGHLELRVADEGPGIPEDRLDDLFSHGYSIRDSRHHHSSAELEFNSRGLGLGLGITQGIVRAHGGTVTGVNRPEGGSLFTIRIPRIELREMRAAA